MRETSPVRGAKQVQMLQSPITFFAVVLVVSSRRISFISYRVTLRLDSVAFTHIKNVYVAFQWVKMSTLLFFCFLRYYLLSVCSSGFTGGTASPVTMCEVHILARESSFRVHSPHRTSLIFNSHGLNKSTFRAGAKCGLGSPLCHQVTSFSHVVLMAIPSDY